MPTILGRLSEQEPTRREVLHDLGGAQAACELGANIMHMITCCINASQECATIHPASSSRLRRQAAPVINKTPSPNNTHDAGSGTGVRLALTGS